MIDNGERMIPASHKGQMVYGEHIVRYHSVAPHTAGKKVLDIASGSGYGSQILAQCASSVIGIDINEESVGYAQNNYSAPNLTYSVGSAMDIPLENSCVDMVVSFETIEHLPDYHKYLDEVKRVLRPNGVFIVSTPNDLEFSEQNVFHLHEFILEELEPLLRKQFANVEFYFQGTWLYSALLARLDFESEWSKLVKTDRTFAQSANKAVYFTAVCSDGPLPVLESYAAISAPWSARENEQADKMRNNLVEQERAEFKSKIDEANREAASQKQAFEDVTNRITDIYQSRSWKVISRLRRIKHALNKTSGTKS